VAEHLKLGRFGEDIAAEHLTRLGYSILKKDFEAPFGQIDVVAQDGDWLVFVEVKTRRVGGIGLPEDAITAKKRRKLISLAYYYLTKYKLPEQKCRFDVISILVGEDGMPIEIRLIKDAFGE